MDRLIDQRVPVEGQQASPVASRCPPTTSGTNPTAAATARHRPLGGGIAEQPTAPDAAVTATSA